ncbi:50S ribosomal protein L23 [Candidatus Parcubacteria bacterium A4]|nr:MAG: 50S ribosomal protein L23 [Candidatus Parcubacteria bacterium A4]
MTNVSTDVNVVRKRGKEHEDAYRVLMAPHVTEKSTDFANKSKYIFKVYNTATKGEIKRAVESVYGVNVLDVKTLNVRRKKQRLGKTMGWVKGYKKAIVKIKEGQEIEVLPR